MIRALIFVLLLGIGVAVSLAFAGSIFDQGGTPEYRKDKVYVIWTETNDIRAICGPRALACAAPGDPCRIWTYPSPAYDTLGHELLHCFTGRFHDRKEPA